MQVGTLFTRVIPQASNRDFMLLAGFDPNLNQKNMVRYITLTAPTSLSLHVAEQDIARMSGAERTEDVTKDAVRKKLTRLFERWPGNYVLR
jgi:hypothetical protein